MTPTPRDLRDPSWLSERLADDAHEQAWGELWEAAS